VNAKVWTVDNTNSSKADSNYLQGVHNIASTGDTIVVMPSLLNYGAITISKKITIYSHGFASHQITEHKDKMHILSNVTINTGVFGVKLFGLVIFGDVYLNGGNHSLLNNEFVGFVAVNV